MRASLPTAPASRPDATSEITVEGVLYKLNLRTHRYGLEDDAGNSIEIVTRDADDEEIGALVNQRARATGMPNRDSGGRLDSVIDASLDPAPDLGLDRGEFWRSYDLEDLVKGKRPIESIDELVIEGLDGEESAAFLDAINE